VKFITGIKQKKRPKHAVKGPGEHHHHGNQPELTRVRRKLRSQPGNHGSNSITLIREQLPMGYENLLTIRLASDKLRRNSQFDYLEEKDV
jgi:hypothetical protein